MKKVDLSLVGSYLHASDDLGALEKFLISDNSLSQMSMNYAMSVLFERIGDVLDIDKKIYDQLSNTNKFYLVRGAFPDREQELRAFVLERFYKFIS
ncbi:hypothetical protein EFU41_18395 [Vibrio cholerae]|uniref:hypothetical protein n=1 Tax=Vibrio cholerae TaxID=666 RepID=UPI000E0AF751|nr:hypothetical protein [Vibrio cholerae]EGR1126259.1 hypothetical protein [Vibrio cholerae]EKF9566629.1 hypothetical protein [Vibrio cholerae]EKG0043025.1 hypothetical protein [Vibrio cholerae]ELH0879469.1 hypothetical protein [Vibrio cholerae]ELR6565879.1 hypothetical protein [Vibrio cholerae]